MKYLKAYMVLNTHNSQFPRLLHFFGYEARPKEMEVSLFLMLLVRALGEGRWWAQRSMA